jgi:hypothetical protein
VDGGEEVSLGLVVARRDGTELFEPGEEVLDQMACLEEIAVIVSADFAVGLGRDRRRLTGRGEWRNNPFVGVEGFVGDQNIGLHRWQKVIGSDEIMRLTAGQEETDWVAQGIDQGVDLGAQPTARAADCLVLAGFFCAPALC